MTTDHGEPEAAAGGDSGGDTIRRTSFRRNRPTDAGWPTASAWKSFGDSLTGDLLEVTSPLDACVGADAAVTDPVFRALKNPYYIGDTPGLTQTIGWLDAWTTQPSAYAVAAETAEDVAAAVNVARENALRLVVRGGGHSYQGTSCAPDSLLIWTRRMNALTMHDAFVGTGCDGAADPVPAVSLGAGCLWGPTYDTVTRQHGRYVQGGGCLTVGVAGLIQSGGFGSFSKWYGTAAGGLLEAEVVTADGKIRVVNARQDPELFWGLKGGGGGSLGVVTRVTVQTHDLPDYFGHVSAWITAESDGTFRALIARVVEFYADNLFNEHWGEQIHVGPDRSISVSMAQAGLDDATVHGIWDPFFAEVRATSGLSLGDDPEIVTMPPRRFWDATYPPRASSVLTDDRPGAPSNSCFWKGNQNEAGWFLHGYHSAWLPADLLAPHNRADLSEALYRAAQHFRVQLHFNKALAGAPEEALARSRDTATNPAVLDAFALAFVFQHSEPAYPGVPGHEPPAAEAHADAVAIDAAIAELYLLVAKEDAGAYVSESNYFDTDWQHSYWGSNYARLHTVKETYDPDGLFFVHNGVGSEHWSADGFTKRGRSQCGDGSTW
ncbi:MAG TPA: FAD-binding oxidoreductase [Microbacteriaceae bacterium]